jgi:PKHD-type hydroxylase
MAQSVSFNFKLPDVMLDSILETINQDEKLQQLKPSTVSVHRVMNQQIRSSKSVFLNSQNWFTGMLYYYADVINRRIYQYDIVGYDGDTVQYAEYDPGDFYNWHSDDINKLPTVYNYVPRTGKPEQPTPTEYVRKLSLSLQLNDDYTGGELQLYQPCLGKTSMETIPNERGRLTIFDSRTLHRVRKVKSGTRKSIVGWIVGPRWR